MTVFNNRASTPIIHICERGEALRVGSKVAQHMWSLAHHEVPKRVTGRHYAHGCWHIPNVVEEERHGLKCGMVRVGVQDIFVCQIGKVMTMGSIITIKCCNYNIVRINPLCLNVCRKTMSSIGNIAAFTAYFFLVERMFDSYHILQPMTVFFNERLARCLRLSAITAFVRQNYNHLLHVAIIVEHRLNRRLQHVNTLVVCCDNNSVIYV